MEREVKRGADIRYLEMLWVIDKYFGRYQARLPLAPPHTCAGTYPSNLNAVISAL